MILTRTETGTEDLDRQTRVSWSVCESWRIVGGERVPCNENNMEQERAWIFRTTETVCGQI